MSNCPKCNESVKGEAKFCPSCGEKIGRRTAEEKKSRLTEKKKGSKAPIFIIAGLVIAGAVAFGALNLSKTPSTTVVGGDYVSTEGAETAARGDQSSSGAVDTAVRDDKGSSGTADTVVRGGKGTTGAAETAARDNLNSSKTADTGARKDRSSSGSAETAARSSRKPSRAADSVTFAISEYQDGKAKYYSYKGPGGKTIKFFVIKSSDGVIRAAFDACDVCYQSKKGYRKEGDFMVCNNCGQRFTSVRINEVRGGCNPAPLERKVEGDNLVIAVADILTGARYF
jgi:hypothetical protein